MNNNISQTKEPTKEKHKKPWYSVSENFNYKKISGSGLCLYSHLLKEDALENIFYL